eukprot:TRINITY_DN55946_c0_g1_i1.p4 TRINITY_DN55946_c0_g1~~TRINITY_DN55946_c0_g1_i1.p4  ORF type:complete len:103 (+),score=10.46 TRINITY_DN55946_c0_g1_i1:180-488(+)
MQYAVFQGIHARLFGCVVGSVVGFNASLRVVVSIALASFFLARVPQTIRTGADTSRRAMWVCVGFSAGLAWAAVAFTRAGAVVLTTCSHSVARLTARVKGPA